MKYLIIGGSKSGKSEIAEKISLTLTREAKSTILSESLTQRRNVSRVSLKNVIYIATMKPYDKEDKERIKKHIQRRIGLKFETLEVERNLNNIVKSITEEDTILIDSITSLLTNEMFCNGEIVKQPSKNILSGLEQLLFKAKNCIIVSDYIFDDAIEYDEVTKNFQKELAIINRKLAKICDNLIECSFGSVKYHKCRGENII